VPSALQDDREIIQRSRGNACGVLHLEGCRKAIDGDLHFLEVLTRRACGSDRTGQERNNISATACRAVSRRGQISAMV